MQEKIAFIGAGNMARAIILGLVNNGVPAQHIIASNTSPEKLTYLATHFNIQTTQDNIEAVSAADVVILAVKPQRMKMVCNEIVAVVKAKKPLVISIAAGVTQDFLAKQFGHDIGLVRAMPNVAATVSASATALCANASASDIQRDCAESIFEAVGVTEWIDEQHFNTVTALSGSGSAYLFLTMEAMQAAAETLGLDANVAKLFTIQTTLGAARLALESEQNVGKFTRFSNVA